MRSGVKKNRGIEEEGVIDAAKCHKRENELGKKLWQ